MRYRSQTWQDIVARNRWAMQTKLEIDGVEHTEISAPIIERATMERPLEIGNVVCSTLRVSVRASGPFAPGAEITVYARISDTQATSEWKKFGVYYIDQQPYDPINGIVSITAYDALKRTELPYCTEQDAAGAWPKEFITVVEDIAERIGVGIDPRVRIPASNPSISSHMVSDPFPDDYSIMDVLSGIGVVMGGNWVITEEGLLRFIPLVGMADYSYRIIDGQGNPVVDRLGNYLVWKLSDSSSEFNVDVSTTVRPGNRPTSRVPIGGTDEEMGGTDATVIVPVVLNSLSTSGQFIVHRFQLKNKDGPFDHNYYINRPTVSDEAQFTIHGSSPYASIEDQAGLEYNYYGLLFSPFDARGCIFDPCAELGDQVRIGSILSVLVSETLTLGVAFRGDLSFPTCEELTTQYPYTGAYNHRPFSGGTLRPNKSRQS